MRLVYIVGLIILMGRSGFSMADGLMDALAGKSKPSPAPSAPAPQPALVTAPKPAPAPSAPVAPVSPPIVPAKYIPPVKKPVDPPPVKAAAPAPATNMSESQAASQPKATNLLSEEERLLGLVKDKRVEALRADVEEERKRRRAAESWDPQSSLQGQGGAGAWKPITVYAIEIRGKTKRALIGYGTKSAAWYTVGSRSNVTIASITEDTVIGRYMNAEKRWEDFQGSVYDVAAYSAVSQAYSGAQGAQGGSAMSGQAPMMQSPLSPVR